MMRRLALATLLALWPALAFAQFATIGATPPVADSSDKLATTAFVNTFVGTNSTHFSAGGVTTGSANAQVIAATLPPIANLAGFPTISFVAGFSNSGATTLNVGVTGAVSVLKKTAAGLVALTTGDIVSGQQYFVTYDGTQYELQTPSSFLFSDANGVLITNITAPATPAAGTLRFYSDSTQNNLTAKNSAGSLFVTVNPASAVANQFVTNLAANGTLTSRQPAFADLTGVGTCAQEPALTGNVTSSAGSCATTIGANQVARTMEAQGVARSLIGVTGNATANVADIQGTANQFPVVNSAGTALAFSSMSGDCTLATGVITCGTFGTFVPTVTTDGTVGTPAYTTQVGSYERTGPGNRQVTVRFNVALSGWTGSPTGNVSINFNNSITSNGTLNDLGICNVGIYVTSTSFASVTAFVPVSSTLATLRAVAAAGANAALPMTAAQAGTVPTFIGVCNYHT